MSTSMEPHDAGNRRAWMAVLARTSRDALKQALEAALDGAPLPDYEWLRAPDIGLAMVRGRIGGTGDAFNLGEATVTRATLRLRTAGGHAPVGVAVHMGRDKERATLAALADALLQTPSHGARLQTRLIEPLAARIADERRRKEAEAAATKVEFFTMVRGE
ncbi:MULTISPECIES: phosphonate C-P lyase system protein PhnG [unclassified Caballeronia]|uniref:phosphonate C-P lyase system protein PhnG n=1 Tax=unclassified Caballeronia TaxID=2646786 RepID=UPI0028582BE5|nr:MULTISPECIES: phosphonate C-P lyase system protein PhnG [unclassified Caballeronia]MDR5817497.1 phosphonate C-P lyase system protein PhnG [Caballeronia sp. LZ033]MDR5882334.1 phosphonate C-P lyase system protein PhnG [Caballeronia sp. LZ032]